MRGGKGRNGFLSRLSGGLIDFVIDLKGGEAIFGDTFWYAGHINRPPSQLAKLCTFWASGYSTSLYYKL